MNATEFSALAARRRSTRAFRADPIPRDIIDRVLNDANQAPSWSNTQPYKIALAEGEVRDRIASALTARFDAGLAIQSGSGIGKLKALVTQHDGLPDGDFDTRITYPEALLPARRATGFGLYQLLGIGRDDLTARNAQMRRNFHFFDAPVALFIFVHGGLREFSVLDAGVWLQTLMLSAEANGLATCAQGALATWAGPVRAEFDVPQDYKLICGAALGYAADAVVNTFNPGRARVCERLLPLRVPR
jgi:nitroreductase